MSHVEAVAFLLNLLDNLKGKDILRAINLIGALTPELRAHMRRRGDPEATYHGAVRQLYLFLGPTADARLATGWALRNL